MHIAPFLFLAVLVLASHVGAASLQLDTVDLSPMSSGWGKATARQSVTSTPLSIGGKVFETESARMPSPKHRSS